MLTVDVDATTQLTVTVDGHAASIAAAVRPVAAGRLRLRSPRCSRWSVTDRTGGAWFPAGVVRKWDVEDRPFFHGDVVEMDVPAEELTVTCARGLEYDVVETCTIPAASKVTTVDGDPPRLFDPASAGWYGGDLHIHMNYSGDLVCAPDDVARMQRGEGLHLANVVVGNQQTSLVYDREMLEEFAGSDLPWSTGQMVAGYPPRPRRESGSGDPGRWRGSRRSEVSRIERDRDLRGQRPLGVRVLRRGRRCGETV